MTKEDFPKMLYDVDGNEIKHPPSYIQSTMFPETEAIKVKTLSHVQEKGGSLLPHQEKTTSLNTKLIKREDIESLGFNCFWQNDYFYIVLSVDKKLIKCYNVTLKKIYSRDIPDVNLKYSEVYFGFPNFITFKL